MGYDSAGAFVKALGIRALSDPEDAEGRPVEKERAAALKIQRIFGVCLYGLVTENGVYPNEIAI